MSSVSDEAFGEPVSRSLTSSGLTSSGLAGFDPVAATIELLRRPGWLRFGYLAAVALVGASIALLRLFPHLTDASQSLCLLVVVFVVAWIWESRPGALAAVLATLGLNFFFLPPLHTFTIEDPRNVFALFVFLGAALLIGRLSATSRLRLRQVEAERKDLISLTELSQAFLADTNRESLLAVAAERLRKAFECESVRILLADEGGHLVPRASSGDEGEIRKDLCDLAYRHGNSASFPSARGGTDVYLPVRLGIQPIGALIAHGVTVSERMVEGCTALLALALEREKFVKLARSSEEMRAREEVKSTLLATLAHDLKTPVTGARMAVENWEARAGGTEDTKRARDAMQRLARLIDDLLQVVRLEAEAAHPRTERVSCGAILEAAVTRFGEALADHSFAVERPRTDLHVNVDPAQITEALGLGLENAARYSPAGASVRLSALVREGSVVLRVEDSGPGIPDADRHRAFEKFVRLPGTASVPGSGLGLYIARSLVELNGGALSLGAAPLGGTAFDIMLPEVP